jgi:hypothetical protein
LADVKLSKFEALVGAYSKYCRWNGVLHSTDSICHHKNPRDKVHKDQGIREAPLGYWMNLTSAISYHSVYITYRSNVLFSTTANPNYNELIAKDIPENFCTV